MPVTPLEQRLVQWARKRAVRALFRNAPFFVLGRMKAMRNAQRSQQLQQKWASTIIQQWVHRRRKKIKFYVILTFDLFNPRHNGGDGKWHRVTDRRYGPLGPAYPDQIARWAHAGLVSVHGNYPHDVQIDIVDWKYESTNDDGVLELALPMQEVPLESTRPLHFQFLAPLRVGGIAPVSLAAQDDTVALRATGECVVDAVTQHLLTPPANQPIKFIPASKYDRVLKKYVNRNSCRGQREAKAPVTRESLLTLLTAIRSDVEPYVRQGFSIMVVRQLCRIFKLEMIALAKDGTVVEHLRSASKGHRHSPLAFYAFHGHMYLLATEQAIRSAAATARETRSSPCTTPAVHLESTHATLQPQCEVVDAQEGVFCVYKNDEDEEEDEDKRFELSLELAGGVHVLRGFSNLRRLTLQLMSEHAIEPRIDKNASGNVQSFSFKNEAGHLVRVVADGHPCQDVDHHTLRGIAAAHQVTYSPDAGIGKLVVQLIARLARARRRMTDAECDATVRNQGERCACGCARVLERKDDKWAVEFDHIVPLADGGLDDVDNIQALSPACHRDKTEKEVERGYYKRQAYASQLNGHVRDALEKEGSNFTTVQFVQTHWLAYGTQVVLHDHPYWTDGTRAVVGHRAKSGGWEIIAEAPPEATPGVPYWLHPGQRKLNADRDASPDNAALYQLRFGDFEALLQSPHCPPLFATNVRRLLALGLDPSEHYEHRKIDVNRCRRNALLFSKYEWPVYCAMDEIEPFDGQVRCGIFYVVTTHGFPLRGCGWYSEPLVQHALAKRYIALDDIQLQLVPSQRLPADFFHRHVHALDKAFGGHAELQKLAPNAFVGLLARPARSIGTTYLSLNVSEAADRFYNNTTGFECHITRYGRLEDGRDVWQAHCVRELAEEKNPYFVYKQVLEAGEFIELDTIRSMVEDEAGGFALEFATDAVLFLVPKAADHVLAAPRPDLQEVDKKYSGDVTVPGFFWDEAREIPRYKWEPPKALLMSHFTNDVDLDPLYDKGFGREWRDLETDGPALAANHDWKPCAKRLLDRGVHCNIDGPPGTGKSTLTRALIDEVVARHGDESFYALAPTNVAARNIGEMSERINTIASFQRKWQHAHEKGGKAMHRLLDTLGKVRYMFIDEISMMHSWIYGLLTAVRRAFPRICLILVGDFKQLAPVLDVWSGDYQASSALHYLCDGNRLQLTECRRADRAFFELYMSADTLDIALFLVTACTALNIAYLHATRIRVCAECMREFSRAAAETHLVPANAEDARSQDMTLFVGMPLVCWKTQKTKGKVIFAHSELWLVTELGDEQVKMQRKLEEVDREAGKVQEDMPTEALPYDKLQTRFRPGYCITVHMSQGKTFRERYTIHDWDFEHMVGRGRYVALSRAKTRDLVQIAPRRRKRSFDDDIDLDDIDLALDDIDLDGLDLDDDLDDDLDVDCDMYDD